MEEILTLYLIASEEIMSVEELIASEMTVSELDIIPTVSFNRKRIIFRKRARVVALFNGSAIK
jgi:hypothetical protein